MSRSSASISGRDARAGGGRTASHAQDAVSIVINADPGAEQRITMMGMIENIEVQPADAAAKVIVNARTGTVVINGAVRIAPAAVAHGKLTVTVSESPRVVQPANNSHGTATLCVHISARVGSAEACKASSRRVAGLTRSISHSPARHSLLGLNGHALGRLRGV